LFFSILIVTPCYADFFDSLVKNIEPFTKSPSSSTTNPLSLNLGDTVVSRLKEALSVGIEKVVKTVSQMNF
jgi:hypothetical protein